MGTGPEEMPLCFNQKLSHDCLRTLHRLTKHPNEAGRYLIPIKLNHASKDRESDGIFMMIPSVRYCTDLSGERVDLGVKICMIHLSLSLGAGSTAAMVSLKMNQYHPQGTLCQRKTCFWAEIWITNPKTQAPNIFLGLLGDTNLLRVPRVWIYF